MNFNLIYFLFVFCVSSLDAVKFRCDYKYTRQGWFKYHKIPLIWRYARWMCHFEGGVLASPITTEIKNTMRLLMGKDDIYTGLHHMSKGHYHSIEGVPLGAISHDWADSEPDNKGNAENCLTMASDGKLSDVHCDEPRPYICYRPNIRVDVNVCGTPDPEYHFDNHTKKCYKFHTKPRDFNGANFVCSAEGGHLAIINSEHEANVIRELINRYPKDAMIGNFVKDYAYLGFFNWGENPQTDWMTIHGQPIEVAGFPKFDAGKPNDFGGSQNCGSIDRETGLLNDLSCETIVYNFICEKDPHYPRVCEQSQNKLY